jgi:hypothetical protein
MVCDHSLRESLHLFIRTLVERLLCVFDVELPGRVCDVGDLCIRSMEQGMRLLIARP